MGSKRLAAFAIFAAVLCLAAGIIYSITHQAERRNAAASQQNENIIECITALGLARITECSLEAAQVPYNETKEWYDLKAQQDMAKWALLMLIVTTVGVVYVALTLNTARQANLGFQESAEKQLRAYVGVITIQLTDFAVGKTPKCVCVLKNFGQTPASEVRYTSALFWAQRKAVGKIHGIFENEWIPIGPMPPAHSHTTEIPFDKKLEEDEFREAIGKGKWLHMVMYVTYRDFTKRRRRLLIHSYADAEQAQGRKDHHMLKHHGHNRST